MGDSTVIRDSPKSSDTRILHTKIKQPGKYPFTPTAQVINFLEFRSTISNLFADIFTNYLSIGKTTCAFYKLGVHPGTEGMTFSKLFRMDNGTNKLDSGSVSFFVLTPV